MIAPGSFVSLCEGILISICKWMYIEAPCASSKPSRRRCGPSGPDLELNTRLDAYVPRKRRETCRYSKDTVDFANGDGHKAA